MKFVIILLSFNLCILTGRCVHLKIERLYPPVGGNYVVGFPENNFTNSCVYYPIDLMVKNFTVKYNTTNYTLPEIEGNDDIYHLDQRGRCAVLVRNITKNTPKVWLVKAEENNTLLMETRVYVGVREPLSFTPKSREVFITESGEYEIGFLPFENITSCTFIQENKNNFTFSIKKNLNVVENELPTPSLQEENMWHYGEVGVCRIRVKNNGTQNTTWTVIALQGNDQISTITANVIVYQKEELIFEPNNNTELYLTEGDKLTVGYNKHKGVTKCYYETSNKDSVEFPVLDLDINVPLLGDYFEQFPNIASHLGNLGMCKIQMSVSNPFSKFSIKMTASNGFHNITSGDITVQYLGSRDLEFVPQQNEVHVLEGQNYTIGFKHHVGIKKCEIKSNTGSSIRFDLDPLKPQNETLLSNTTADIIHYRINNLCKIQITNASKNGPTLWTISPYTNANFISQKLFKILVHSRDELENDSKIKEKFTLNSTSENK